MQPAETLAGHDLADLIDYAHRVATTTMRTWPRAQREDGYADAMVGLCEAARSYQPARGATFTAYAYSRIRGAVLDGIRTRLPGAHLEALRDYPIPEPEEETDHAALAQAINRLQPRTRLIITLYYFEGLTMKDIGTHLGVTESRISQIIKTATRGAYISAA